MQIEVLISDADQEYMQLRVIEYLHILLTAGIVSEPRRH